MNSQHVHHHSNKRNEKRGDDSVHSSPDALKPNYKKHQDDSNHLKFSRSRSESNDSNKLIRKKQYDRNESSKSSQDGLPVKKSSSNSSMSSSSDSLHHSPSNSSESHKLNKSSRNNSSPSSYKKSISNEHDDDENNNSSIKEQKIANDEQPLSHDNSDFDESIKIKESIIEHETVMNADEIEEEKTKDNSISNKSNSSSNSKKGDNYIQDDIATSIQKESNENETNHETSNPDANETSNNQSDLHAIDDKKMEQSSKIFESDEGKNNQKENGENDQQNDIENQSKADDSHDQEQESDAGSEDSNPYLHHRFQVLRSFIKKIPSKKAKDGYVIDVSGVFSSKCLEAFVKASAKPPKRAEESFFQAMRAHVGGYRGHDHFTPEEETAMLKYIRFNPNWPCFKGKFSELKFQKRDKGYYEKRATKDHQQDVPTPTSNKSSNHHFLDKDNRNFAHSKDNAKSETKSSSESSKETKPNRNNQETEDEDDDNDNEDNEEDEGDEDQEENEEDIKAQFLVNHKKKRKKVRKSLESILAKKRKPRGVMLRGGGWSKVEESELAAIVLNNYDLDTPSDKIDWEFVVKNHNWGRTPHAAERRWNGKIRPKEKLERDEAVKRAFESSKRKSASYSLRAKNGEKSITTTSSSTHIESSAQTEATESISVEVDKSKIALDKKVEMRNRRSQLTQGSRVKMEVQENQETAPSKSLPPSVSSTSGPTLTINEKVVEQDHDDDDDDDEIFESSSKRQKTSTEPSNNDHVELEIRESVAKPTIATQISAPSTTAAESTEVVRSSNQSESMEQEEQKLQVASSTPHSSTTAAATVPAPASAPPMPVQPQPAPSSYYPYPPYYMGYPYPPMYPPGYPPQPLPNPSPSSVPQMPMHPMAVPVPVPVPVPYPMQSAHPGYYGAYPPRQAPPYPYPPPGYPSPYPPYAHGYPPPSPYGARPPQM